MDKRNTLTIWVGRSLLGVMLLSASVAQATSKSGVSAFTNANADGLTSTMQDGKTVTGTVSDEYGPVTGANVVIKGTTTGTITDLDGKFMLNDVPAGAVLQISYIGYTTQEIPVGNQTEFTIDLKEDSQSLDELVVVGYGVQKKVNLSGAVQAVGGEVLENRPITNVNTGLQGAVPNLNITRSSGRANEAPSMNIRGMGSINAGSNGGDAFILVDNVPVSAEELARINPADIENISVLKDASAAAIYGARAAFGVVLVTTKRAKSDKLQISASGNYGIRTRGEHPEYITDPVTVMEMKNAAAQPLRAYLYSQQQIDYALQREQDPSLPIVALDPADPNKWAYYGSTDWMDETYRNTTSTYSADFNIAKKDDKLSYYVSGGYYQENGLLRYGNDKLKRFNFRSNADLQITKWWKAGLNIAYTNSNYGSPTVLDTGVSFFHQINRKPSLDIPRNPDGTWTSVGAGSLGMLQEGGRTNDQVNETSVSISSKFDLIKDVWTLNADANFRFTNENKDAYWQRVPYKAGPNEPIQYETGEFGSNDYTSFRAYDTRYAVYNIYTNFVKTFNEKHFFNIMAGFNSEYTDYREDYMYREGIITSNLPEIGLSTGTQTTTNTRHQLALQGFFGRINYIYDNRYILEFNGRYDGSSRFPHDDQWGFFPSGSVAWSVTSEEFFKPIAEKIQMSNLKLRGSYGSLGNQVVIDSNGNQVYYPSIAAMSSGQIGQILDGELPIAVYQPGLVSASFTWETVNTGNFGMDLGFLNNQLTATFDIYKRITKNMLGPSKELPAVVGAEAPRENAADMKTRGWELSLQWRDQFELVGSPFQYGIKANISDSRSFITKYDNYVDVFDENGNKIGVTSAIENSNLNSQYYVGMEIGEIWGFINDGRFATQEEVDALDQSEVGEDDQSYRFYVGDTKYKDLNGDGRITRGQRTLADPGDRKIIGNSSIRLPYSFTLDAAWKGFDVSAFFQGVGKRDWYPEASNFYFWGIYAQPWTNVTVLNMDHWTAENPDAYFPRVKAYAAEGNSELGMPQTQYLQNASYLRLKNLTLGYTLPKALVNQWHIENLRFYFSAENLWTWNHLDEKLDPETQTTGNLGKSYPMQRTFSFGFNLGF
ncbi:hypothetical protein B5F77_02485 [Parabacteroides sp. An277]|uniref:SusC/RagA family TonB-linked outer membrane protein n=1 Tax=Parabacteroides sp. An277 TaxID=1965619 RepID=UPI000B37F1AA|nr:TonB-dependent receptor [Parabacteroides sp. An277]OUO54814.1 hypothetical protein B5F77_02485 [Parabacteroides sp. An277]